MLAALSLAPPAAARPAGPPAAAAAADTPDTPDPGGIGPAPLGLDPWAQTRDPGAGIGGSVQRLAPEPTAGGGGSSPDSIARPGSATGSPPGSDGGTGSSSLDALRAAILPAPSGDPFFDVTPPGTAEAAPGTVLDHRDVTAVAAPLAGAPITRADQFVVRSTEPDGDPTRATATLLHPATPWSGEGPRPVLVNALPIDSLGTRCTPGYTLAHGLGPYSNFMDFLPPTTAIALAHGYAVLVPDHQGPEMAYADPVVAGHAILDTVRGMRQLAPEYEEAPFAVTGYSGGAIAALGAAKHLDGYAPDLADDVAGVAIGGVPADFEMLLRSMSGNAGVGLLTAAVFGLSRHNPELLALSNNLALQMATGATKDQCTIPLAAMGATLAPIEALTTGDGVLQSAPAREFYARTRMADVRVSGPLLVYQGAQEFWLPTAGTRALVGEQCALGATVEYREVLGEHGIAAVTGFQGALEWLDQRMRGVPAPSTCP